MTPDLQYALFSLVQQAQNTSSMVGYTLNYDIALKSYTNVWTALAIVLTPLIPQLIELLYFYLGTFYFASYVFADFLNTTIRK